MRIILDMTGGAVHGRTLENIVLVTVGAGGAGVLAIEFERELGMVDVGGFPAAWGVAGSTFGSQLTVVRIIRAVTGNTAGGCILEIVVLVTIGAGGAGVLTIELERELGMIDVGGLPAAWGVTGSAFGSQLTVVSIVCTVAGDTAGGCVLEIVVLVTVGA